MTALSRVFTTTSGTARYRRLALLGAGALLTARIVGGPRFRRRTSPATPVERESHSPAPTDAVMQPARADGGADMTTDSDDDSAAAEPLGAADGDADTDRNAVPEFDVDGSRVRHGAD